jgi:hypothetical protein
LASSNAPSAPKKPDSRLARGPRTAPQHLPGAAGRFRLSNRYPPDAALIADSIPPEVLWADQVHHRVLQEVHWSRHLNPQNLPEAERAALRGSPVRFTYQPLIEADQHLRALDLADPPRDHPAGRLVGACLDATRLFLRALRDRTPLAFHRLNQHSAWYPDPHHLTRVFPEPTDRERPTLAASSLALALGHALRERSMLTWRVELDPIMSARVLVDAAKRLIRVNPRATFRPRDPHRLIAHEIDVHAVRAENGERQPLRCFQTGLPGSLLTEEGLALVAEERATPTQGQEPGGMPPALARQQDVAQAILQARELGITPLYRQLAARIGPGPAWSIAARLKRGLENPEEPGVFAKDSVYLQGYLQVKAYLSAGGSVDHLYVGKVGLADPVPLWLSEGWIVPGRVPPLWKRDPAT